MPDAPQGAEQFRWEDLNHNLFAASLEDLAKRIITKGNRLLQSSGDEMAQENNWANYESRFIQIQTDVTDEFARETCEVCCEVWQQLGRTVSAAFVKEVCGHFVSVALQLRRKHVADMLRKAKRGPSALDVWSGQIDQVEESWRIRIDGESARLAELFKRRESEQEREQLFIRRLGELAQILPLLSQEIARLQSRKSAVVLLQQKERELLAESRRKTEIEEGLKKHQKEIERLEELLSRRTFSAPQHQVTPVEPVAHRSTSLSPLDWGGLRSEFESLRHEEVHQSPHNKDDCWLVAQAYYQEEVARGEWLVYRGIHENFKARFDLAAARAGSFLGGNDGVTPRDRWLDSLFIYLKEKKSSHLQAATTSGGMIIKLCEASATYCAKLETDAIEANSNSARVTSSIRRPSITPRKWKPSSRERIIMGAIQAKLTGLKYCKELDRKSVLTPATWRECGCPKAYSEAYMNSKWTHRIQDEKSRLKKKYSGMTPQRREAAIQGGS